MTPNIKVCSNHFVLGQSRGLHPYPCLYMKGYYTESHTEIFEVEKIMKKLGSKTEDELDCIETRSGKKKRKTTEACKQTNKKKRKAQISEINESDGASV